MSIPHIKYPGHQSFEYKVNAVIDQANIFETMRGDEVFIKVRKGPGGLIVSLNWQAILARIPKTVPISAQPYKVYSIPAAISGTVLPWVVANAILPDGSLSPQNTNVGIVQAHSPGEIFDTLPISIGKIFNSGSALLDNFNKPIGIIESGSYGQLFQCECNRSGGSNGGAGVMITLTYDLLTPDRSTILKPGLSVNIPRLLEMTVTAATKCIARINNSGQWEIVLIGEYAPTIVCDTGGSSGSSSPGFMGGM